MKAVNPTVELNRKYNYLLHVNRVLGSKSRIDYNKPKMFKNLP